MSSWNSLLLKSPRALVHWSAETDAIAEEHIKYRRTMQPILPKNEQAIFDTPEDIQYAENKALKKAYDLFCEVYDSEPPVDFEAYKLQVRPRAKSEGHQPTQLKALRSHDRELSVDSGASQHMTSWEYLTPAERKQYETCQDQRIFRQQTKSLHAPSVLMFSFTV